MPTPTSPPPLRPARRTALGVVALLALAGLPSGCGLGGPFSQTAYCDANDPVVTPTSVAPGDELAVRIDGVGGVDCSTDLPDRARYGISLISRVSGTGNDDRGSHYYQADLATLDPDDDGAAQTTVIVPKDMPPGPAELSVHLENAMTFCRVHTDYDCGPDPLALVEITG